MPRYRRVNIDGQSLYKTETRTTAAALLPGTAATINSSDKFAQATALTGRLYIIDVGYHQGLVRIRKTVRSSWVLPVSLPWQPMILIQ